MKIKENVVRIEGFTVEITPKPYYGQFVIKIIGETQKKKRYVIYITFQSYYIGVFLNGFSKLQRAFIEMIAEQFKKLKYD